MAKKPKTKKKKIGIRPGDLDMGGGRVARLQKVANSYGLGIDRQWVVQDTISNLLRRGHIREPQYMAAIRVQQAVETTVAISSVLDPSKSGGGGFGPRSKSEGVLFAAQSLNQARLWLGLMTFFIVEHVAGKGHSIEEVAAMIKRRPTRRDCDKVGADFREGLSTLAAKWWGRYGKNQTVTVQALLAIDARPDQVVTGEFSRQDLKNVAHIDRDRLGKVTVLR